VIVLDAIWSILSSPIGIRRNKGRVENSKMRAIKEKYQHEMSVLREEMSQQFKQIKSMAQLKPDALTKKRIQ
jgi:phage host-nuclease inhibitor protein Gam